MNFWNFEDFWIGSIECQIVRFDIKSHKYIMIFNRLDTEMDLETLEDKARELKTQYKFDSYKVTFDLQDNFDKETFYEPPMERRGIAEIKELGRIICEIIYAHYESVNAKAYFFLADNMSLKRFYDRLAVKYAARLGFKVIANLGAEKSGYEIQTPIYQDT